MGRLNRDPVAEHPHSHADPRLLAAVFAGGVVGAAARAGVVELLPTDAGEWPWATFAVNILGALLLGYVAARAPSGPLRSFWAAGVCGALTTFSTMQLELLELLDDGHHALAAAYALASVTIGLGAVALPGRLGRRAEALR